VEGKKYKIITEENSNFFYNSREMMFRFCNFKNAYTLLSMVAAKDDIFRRVIRGRKQLPVRSWEKDDYTD
jgi:hypothetical protein